MNSVSKVFIGTKSKNDSADRPTRNCLFTEKLLRFMMVTCLQCFSQSVVRIFFLLRILLLVNYNMLSVTRLLVCTELPRTF
jgi:hypothetical protein